MRDEAKEYDLVVIGGGPAGVIGARTANVLGKSVALVDSHHEPRRCRHQHGHRSQQDAPRDGAGAVGDEVPQPLRRGPCHGSNGEGRVTTIPEHDVDETINGKETRVTTVKVALEPGETGRPHRHAGPVFGYVLEGEFQLGLGEDLNSEASTLPDRTTDAIDSASAMAARDRSAPFLQSRPTRA